MALLSVRDLSLNLAGKQLLDHVALHLEAGDRLCLTGRNGVGKSSLLAVLSGDLAPDSGTVLRDSTVRFGRMPQDVPDHWHGTVFEIVADGMGEEGKILVAAHRLALGQDIGLTPELRTAAQHLLDSGEGWDRHGEVLAVIRQLGLKPDADFSTLSGGSRRRATLARALLISDCLLLDEPVNHLDIKTITWLEDFLIRRSRMLIFISHDRTFAKHLATRTAELDRGKLYVYNCGLDRFLDLREERLEAEERQNAHFDKKLSQEEAWIRQGVKARRTRNMGRVRALQALRAERQARKERQGLASMRLAEAEKSGKLVFDVQNVSFTYPDGFEVFHDFSTIIQRGDRIGIIGDNGTGKTTLLKVLLGEFTPTSGQIRRGTKLEIAFFDQLRSTLDLDKSVMDNIADGNDTITIDGRPQHVAGYLRNFLFPSDRLSVSARILSGGEKNRLLLAKLFAKPSNLLVLDEPTNDLDIETLELLEELIGQYQGTVLVVSHDRTFLDNIATMTLALEGDKQVHEYVGGYTDWLRQRPAIQSTENLVRLHTHSLPSRRLSFKEQTEKDQLQKELASLPEQVKNLETEQATLEQRLAEGDFFTRDPEGFKNSAKRLAEIDADQTALLTRWEKIEARLAELKR